MIPSYALPADLAASLASLEARMAAVEAMEAAAAAYLPPPSPYPVYDAPNSL